MQENKEEKHQNIARTELDKNILLYLGFNRNHMQDVLAQTKLHYGGYYSNSYPNALLSCKCGDFIGVKMDELKDHHYDEICYNVDEFIKMINESYVDQTNQ